MSAYWPWLTLIILGAYHGLNPGMGWLFAVARGLQEKRRTAVLHAFIPIAIGHAASVAAVVALVVAAQAFVDAGLLRMAAAGGLIVFGLYKLLVPMSHPRWVGMQVNFRDLTVWSFLMATAHGAGLMLLPIIMRFTNSTAHAAAPGMTHAGHTSHAEHVLAATTIAMPMAELAAVSLHTVSMFVVMAVVAVVVFEKVGLAILRRAWFNLDLVWALALIATGAISLVV